MATGKGKESSAKAQALASERRWQFLTSYGVKWVAIVTMLVDHAGAILMVGHFAAFRDAFGMDAAAFNGLYYALRHVGRIAFPLFCFLLSEGFAHTHSRPRYAWRLFLFALIAELPYDWALYGAAPDLSGLLAGSQRGWRTLASSLAECMENQSVMWTLLTAFLALWGGDALGGLVDRRLARGRAKGGQATACPDAASPRPARAGLSPAVVACTVVLVVLGAWVADVCEMSYHAFGVLLIGALYLGRGRTWLQFLLGCALVGWYCWDHGSAFESYAIVGLALIFLYNGRRGRSMKWFFYLFYPCHLLLLGALEACLL